MATVIAVVWLLVSLAIILIVWAAKRYRLAAPQTMALWSVSAYLTSLALPALGFGNEIQDALFGCQAWIFSFLGSYATVFDNERMRFEDAWLSVAYGAGAVANSAFILGYIAYLVSWWRATSRKPARWLALTAMICGGASVVPILFVDRLNLSVLYPGYGLWVAGMLALWLGSTQRS